MPPSDEPGRRHRSPRHGEPEPRWGGGRAPSDDPYGDVTGERPASGGRHGTSGPRHGGYDDGWRGGEEARPPRPRHGGTDLDDDPRGPAASGPAPWPPPSALPHGVPPSPAGPDDRGPGPSWEYGSAPNGRGQAPPPSQFPPSFGRNPASGPASAPPAFGQAPPSPPHGQAPSSPYGQAPSSPYGQAPQSPPYGQSAGPPRAAGSPPPGPAGRAGYDEANGYGPSGSPNGAGPNGAGPNGAGPNGAGPNGAGPNGAGPNGAGPQGTAPQGTGRGDAGANGRYGAGSTAGQPAGPGNGPGSTAVQPPVGPTSGDDEPAPLLSGGTPPPARKREAADAASSPGAARGDDSPESATDTGTGALGASAARHRRGGAATGPGRDDSDDTSGPGRRSRGKDDKDDGARGKKKRKGSFWRELPLLVVVAIVLTFVIQTFIARIYVIPSASMEQTLHGCTGCSNDRVVVDKVTYRFTDPSPGDVVVFKGPPAWLDNDEVGDEQPSSNALIRGFQDALSLVGLAAPNEKDFVKRVIATGGQTVACCDPGNHVLVDGKPINEPYLYFQPGLGNKQATFDPVRVPDGQLWVMGDNRNNSADARFHGPVPVSDVIGKVRFVVLPISRWSSVPTIDPQATTAALGGPEPIGTGTAGAAAGALLAVPVIGAGRRLRRAAAAERSTSAPPRPGPEDASDEGGPRAVEADQE